MSGRGANDDRVDWVEIGRRCAGLALPDLLDSVADAIPGLTRLDVWLWDHQHRVLTNIVTGDAEPGPAALEGPATVVTPVRFVGDDVGVITAEHDDDPPSEPSLEALAGFLGAVVRASGPILDMVDKSRRRREMSLPAEMQWSLLPPTRLEVADAILSAGVEPAYDTGGDVFDYALEGSSLFAAVLDARGHGLRSAATATVATGAMRRARRQGADLAMIADEIGAAVAALGDDEEFVSAVLVTIDIEEWKGSWLSAGHLPPLVVGRHGLRTLELRPTLPLGMSLDGETSAPVVEAVRLEPGESLVLYSDGIVENAVEDAGESVGDARFHDVLRRVAARAPATTHLAREVIEELLGLTGAVFRDDATLLALSRA